MSGKGPGGHHVLARARARRLFVTISASLQLLQVAYESPQFNCLLISLSVVTCLLHPGKAWAVNIYMTCLSCSCLNSSQDALEPKAGPQ